MVSRFSHSQGTVVTKPATDNFRGNPRSSGAKGALNLHDPLATDRGVPGHRSRTTNSRAEGGTLDALRQVSEHLSRHYGWEEGWATEFVLTDRIPPIRPIESSSSLPSTFTSLARIVLTIDPALSPKEVMDKYRAERTQLAGNRHRDLSEKHLQLAAFTSSRPAGGVVEGPHERLE